MSTDDQIKPAGEQKPPDLEELAKNYLWEFLRRTFGPRGAVIIFVTVIAALYFHSEIGQVVFNVRAQIVEWWPLPKAKPDVFTVAIARLEDDDEKFHMEVNITRDLRDLGISNGLAVLEFPRIISDQDPQAGHAKARKWLTESGAQVLIWGRVLVVPGKPEVPQLYWTNSEGASEKTESGRYGLDENLRLPTTFQSNLSDILRLLVVTQSSAFNGEEGHFVADRLRPFIERVRHLLEGDAAKNWTPEDIARTKVILANSLETVGEQAGDNDALSEAIDLYNGGFTGFTRQQYPLDWAMTQTNLGVALTDLGERMHDTDALCEALRDHVSAWQVSSEAAPHYALIAVAGAKTVVAAIHNQSRGTAPQCLRAYSADLNQMGVPN